MTLLHLLLAASLGAPGAAAQQPARPARLEDVEEIDVVETQLGHSEFVDAESRRAAMEGAHAIDEAARHRSVVEQDEP